MTAQQGPNAPEMTLEWPTKAEPGMCPMLTNMVLCDQKATGYLVDREGRVLAYTCEAHGNAAEPPWSWRRGQ